MLYLQILANGLMLGGLYACIGAGFSLVWGVLNVINILHGSFIVLGGYLAFYAYSVAGIHPFFSLLIAAPVFFALGYVVQSGLLNRVIGAPVLLTLTLTFGLDLMLSNGMLAAFTADFKKVTLDPPLGAVLLGPVVLPVDRLIAMVLALALVGLLYLTLSRSRIGRAIVAVRMDREAAALMGVRVKTVYAVTFGLGEHQLVAHVVEDAPNEQKGIYPRHFGLVFLSQAPWHALADRAKGKGLTFY